MFVNMNPNTNHSIVDGKVIHTLLEPMIYKAFDDSVFEVPTGYRTNGASMPRFLWSFINPFGVAFSAAILHDYLVRESEKTLNTDINFYGKKIKWSAATEYFKEALYDVTATPEWKIPIICAAVNFNGRINHRGNF